MNGTLESRINTKSHTQMPSIMFCARVMMALLLGMIWLALAPTQAKADGLLCPDQGSYNTPGFATGAAVVETTAYIADGVGGLQIIDVTDPTSPTEIGSYSIPVFAQGIFVADSIAYVAASTAGIFMLDASSCSTNCPADITGDGELNFFDVSAFLAAFAAGCP